MKRWDHPRPIFSPEGPDGTRELLGGKYYVTAQPEEDAAILQEASVGGKKRFYLCEHENASARWQRVPVLYDGNGFLDKIPKGASGLFAMLRCLIVPERREKEAGAGILKKYERPSAGRAVCGSRRTPV